MSKIDDLIAKYCPNGVEMDTIGNLCKINRGRVMSKDYLAANQGDYPVYSSQTANEGMLGKIKTYDYDGEYLTWTTDGAYAGSVFYRKGKFSITNICGLLDLQSDKLLIKFLYYYLGNVTKNYVNAGMGNPKLMSNVMERIKVAIPPLAVQEEIVNILDSFTLLEAELEAELEARKKQYEHYRDELLNSENMKGEVNVVKLGEVATLVNGRAYKQEELLSSGKYKVLRVGNFFSSDKWYFSDLELDDDKYCYSGDLLYAWSASFGARIWDGEKTIFHYHIWNIKPSDKVNKKYLMYWLNSMTQNLKNDSSHGATMMHITKQNMEQTSIPIPSVAEQERIVSILDKFDALVNDMSDGLPAEINARRQQYEYYRDKLLNFEPMAA